MDVMVKLPSYTYATIKHQLSKLPILKSQINLLVATSIITSILVIPTFVFLFSLVLLYRKCIDLLLHFHIEHRYRGLLRGVDTICCNQPSCTPSFFFLIDYNKSHEDIRQDFINLLRQCRYARHEKLFYSWSSFFGYHYYYKNNLKVEDYITIADMPENTSTINAIKNKEDFANVIVQYDTAKMPDDNNALFHIIIYPQQVKLPQVEGCKLVCFKMHHALADGKAILGWMMADLADKEPNHQTNGLQNGGFAKPTNGVQKQIGKCVMDDIIKSCKKTLFDDKIKVLPSDYHDDNILLGRNLRDEKFICWFSDFSSEYIDKIKTIRKSREGVSFLDVINTCISSSLQKYYEKHSNIIPEEISGGVVLSPANYSFRYGNPADFTFSNEFSVGGFRFPIVINKNLNKREEILEKLKFCQREYQAVKESIDVKYFYWLSDVFSLLPYQLPTFFASQLKITIGVSSLPGSDKQMTLFGGHLMKDVILMAPNSPGTALHFVNCSYGNRFKISLTIDKSVVENFANAQSIVDGIIDNIDLLYDIVTSPN